MKMDQNYLNRLRDRYTKQKFFKAELPSHGKKQGIKYIGTYKFEDGVGWIERKDIQSFQQKFPYVTIHTKGESL